MDALFQLSRGGGIHHQLLSYKPGEKLDTSSPSSSLNKTIRNDHSITNFYPGMADVYALHIIVYYYAKISVSSTVSSLRLN